MEVSISELVAARARRWHVIVERHEPALESDRGGGELPGGPGGIASLRHLVEERPARVSIERFPQLRRNPANKAVRVVARRRVEGEHAAGFRVDRDRSALQRIAEDLRGEALQRQIDVRVQWIRGLRRHLVACAGLAHHTSERVHLDVAYALSTAESRFVLTLESVLSNLLPGLVSLVAWHRELGLGDFAHVANERSDHRAIRIVALGCRLDDQPGKINAALLEHGHDIERGVGEYRGRPVPRTLVAPNSEVDLFVGERNDRRQPHERRA